MYWSKTALFKSSKHVFHGLNKMLSTVVSCWLLNFFSTSLNVASPFRILVNCPYFIYFLAVAIVSFCSNILLLLKLIKLEKKKYKVSPHKERNSNPNDGVNLKTRQANTNTSRSQRQPHLSSNLI